MELHPIDPRDGTQEVDEPDYRVYFRRADGATEEWRLTHVEDVLEVIQWAEERAGQRGYDLYAEWPLVVGLGLVLLRTRTPR